MREAEVWESRGSEGWLVRESSGSERSGSMEIERKLGKGMYGK